jgi:hypothetical protein
MVDTAITMSLWLDKVNTFLGRLLWKSLIYAGVNQPE